MTRNNRILGVNLLKRGMDFVEGKGTFWRKLIFLLRKPKGKWPLVSFPISLRFSFSSLRIVLLELW